MIRRMIAIFGLILLPLVALAADYPLTDANTVVTFIGTKPDGGEHKGGFKGITGTASVANNDPATLKISLEIDMTRLYSDNPSLTNHLKSPDFFSVKTYPKAKFVSTKVEKAGNDYKITGDLTMVGKTKPVTFVAKVASQGDALTITSNFSIEKSNWGMNYGKAKIENEVKLSVSVKTK